MTQRRVPFVEAVDADEFGAFCTAQGWRYDGALAGPPDDPDAVQHAWVTADGTEAHLLHDTTLHWTYVVVVGPQDALVETRIRIAFDCLDTDTAMARFAAATTWEDRVEALSIVAVTAPAEFHAGTFEAIAAGLRDAAKPVRHIAALAVFYAPWPQFLPLLAPLADADPDPSVRETAQIAVETLSQPG